MTDDEGNGAGDLLAGDVVLKEGVDSLEFLLLSPT